MGLVQKIKNWLLPFFILSQSHSIVNVPYKLFSSVLVHDRATVRDEGAGRPACSVRAAMSRWRHLRRGPVRSSRGLCWLLVRHAWRKTSARHFRLEWEAGLYENRWVEFCFTPYDLNDSAFWWYLRRAFAPWNGHGARHNSLTCRLTNPQRTIDVSKNRIC